MDTLDQLRAFIATAQYGSFTGGAEVLGISNRLTSKYVAELERKLGTRLLQRTTRKVGLTPEGEALLAKAPRLLEELDSLLGEFGADGGMLRGTLRISAPVTFGETRLAGLIDRFSRAHRGLKIDLRLSDGFVDLASEGIDLAFRIGVLEHHSLRQRKLGEFGSILVASPEYLDRAGRPSTPADLPGHECIIDTNRRNPHRWIFTKDGLDETVTVSGRINVNSARAALRLAREGAGIAYAPDFSLVETDLDGQLERLLPDYATAPGAISIVWLDGHSTPPKVRALIDFAAAELKPPT